jgi:hypothetical protein
VNAELNEMRLLKCSPDATGAVGKSVVPRLKVVFPRVGRACGARTDFEAPKDMGRGL